jgi:hypothetical protein
MSRFWHAVLAASPFPVGDVVQFDISTSLLAIRLSEAGIQLDSTDLDQLLATLSPPRGWRVERSRASLIEPGWSIRRVGMVAQSHQ